jgi:hypothetical protein
MTSVEQQKYRNLIDSLRALIACIEPLPSTPEQNEVVRALNRYVAQLIVTMEEEETRPR